MGVGGYYVHNNGNLMMGEIQDGVIVEEDDEEALHNGSPAGNGNFNNHNFQPHNVLIEDTAQH